MSRSARPIETITAPDLLRRADIALYHSKHGNGSNISVFDGALDAVTRRRAELENELRGAIERGEMYVEYQPIMRLTTGRVAKFEVLARWNSRRFGAVGPEEFIRVAEDTGLIDGIGDWVLETACRQAAVWREQYDDFDRSAASVAVNVSARQLSDADFPRRVSQILDDLLLPPAALILEITETAVMVDFDASVGVLAELRDLGVRLSMDDFGTGYSSLTYLRRIRVDTLKIDRSFVTGLGRVPEDAAIVQSIVNLGHSFGIEVVAEGVETLGQLDHLIELGCDYGQGFLWSEAVDAAAAGALLKDTVAQPATAPAYRPPRAPRRSDRRTSVGGGGCLRGQPGFVGGTDPLPQTVGLIRGDVTQRQLEDVGQRRRTTPGEWPGSDRRPSWRPPAAAPDRAGRPRRGRRGAARSAS